MVLGCSSPSTTTSRHYDASPAAIDRHIAEASQRFDVPEQWIRAVMHVESSGRTHADGRPITSSAGAMGLMQVMPGTYVYLRDRYGLGHDPHHPRDNIFAGTAYIREMYDMFGSPGFLAAYNAGPGRYTDHLRNGRPLPAETRRYMALIYPRIVGILPGDARYATTGGRRISERPPRRPDHPG
jgi:soluble lytic murein transglycosylase-like protein